MAGILMIMLATSLWALDTLIRYPLLAKGYSTLDIVLLEHGLLLLVVLPILWRAFARFRTLTGRQWLQFVVIGGLGSAIGSLAFTHAFSVLNPSLVILLQKLQPVVAAILAYWLLKERLSGGYFIALGLSIAGSLLMVAPSIAAMFSEGSFAYTSENIAVLLAFAAALLAVVSWGASTVFGKQLSNSGLNSQELMAGRFSVGFAVLLVISLFASSSSTAPLASPSFVVPVALMVLLSGLAGMYLYYQGLARTQSSVAALAEMFFPVAAVLLNWAVLGANLSAFELLGGAILVLGSVLAQVDARPQPAVQGELTSP